MQHTTHFRSFNARVRGAFRLGAVMALATGLAAGPAAAASSGSAKPAQAQMKRGKQLYHLTCRDCHEAKGQGLVSAYPPLAKVDFSGKHRAQTIDVVLKGLHGKLKVNGQTYNGTSPKFDLTDQQVSDLLTYIFNSWGNNFGIVTKKEVAAERKKIGATSTKKKSNNGGSRSAQQAAGAAGQSGGGGNNGSSG